ncbi:MAG TPA: hypothetical protein VJ747_03920 [Stellaceae bacterium]|nr:hypothetical protein [Stellaceae bacterium]
MLRQSGVELQDEARLLDESHMGLALGVACGAARSGSGRHFADRPWVGAAFTRRVAPV